MNPRAAFTLWPWLIILAMLSSLILLMNNLTRGLYAERECKARMERIYMALELHELANGHLPKLEFYPDNPREGRESLRAVLAPYGLNGSDCVCPSAHPLVREKGLSYLWNVALNNQSLSGRQQPDWMLIEIEALNPKLHGPHFRQYHILYTDGKVQRTSQIPYHLPGGI